ncbi:hypothetical protein DIURU_005475 [Diutina rugosa]|uniref:Protein BIG1 n=1 Tax=Diutina rugosa TaxID=5481 RepID=A0A642UD18_DIURU|nr:uncharacterized protein DIURU_005475 [Diutina rugosa]KAA8896962.1 hypothetical protein DIURU_005475 [Diutina rugosa]
MKATQWMSLFTALGAVSAFKDCVKVSYPGIDVEHDGYVESKATFNSKVNQYSSAGCVGDNTQFIVYQVAPGILKDQAFVNVQGAPEFDIADACHVIYKEVKDAADLDLTGSNWLIEETPRHKSKMVELYHYARDRLAKRESFAVGGDDADEAEALAAEVSADFAAAYSLLSEEGDQPVTIMKTASGDSKVDLGSGLFSEYQFFTPGLLTITFVVLFLVFVLFNAVSWLSSIQITYAAFEKQVDIDKKTE